MARDLPGRPGQFVAEGDAPEEEQEEEEGQVQRHSIGVRNPAAIQAHEDEYRVDGDEGG